MTDDVRDLVSVRIVDKITPIEGADRIEVATVDGWEVIVGKGEFPQGSDAVFFEIDSALPLNDKRFEFLESRGSKTIRDKKYHVLKTIRLRGHYSQGLLMPITILSEEDLAQDNLAEALGVIKYDPAEVEGKSVPSQAKGNFPTNIILKTDAERVQNLTNRWEDIIRIRDDIGLIPTLKYDGTSVTYIVGEDGLRVCSRNWEIKYDESLPQVTLAKEAGIDILPVGTVVQAEMYGEGIQGNPHRIKGKHLAVFNVAEWDGKNPAVLIPRRKWWTIPDEYRVWELPFALPDTVEEAIAQVDGLKLPGTDYLAEGIVWHTADGSIQQTFKFRDCFKVINNKFLLKKG